MEGSSVGILLVGTIAVTLVVSWLLRGRNAQEASVLTQDPPAPAAGGAPVEESTGITPSGNAGMTSWQKFWITLILIVVIAVGFAYIIISGAAQELLNIPLTTLILWVAVLTFAAIIWMGIKEHYKTEGSKGPKFLVTTLAVFLTIFLATYGLFGPDAIERGFRDIYNSGQEFANRVPGQNTATPVSTRGSLCGPDKFIDGYVSSQTTPTRFTAELACSAFVPQKSAGEPIQISYNGEAAITWFSGDAPEYAGTVRYADVRSLNGTSVYVKFSFPY
jgi:NADH:ubiquinone oxidoreductase subunit 3 (subunit A)